MANASVRSGPFQFTSPGRPGWKWLVFAFGYWLACMAALEPGNIANALAVGHPLDWTREAGRLAGAGVLGASATPVLLWLARRAPVQGVSRMRNAACQALSIAALAIGLVVISCFLASWAFAARPAPSADYVQSQVFANSLLVGLCLTGLAMIVQVAARFQALPAGAPTAPVAEPWATRLSIGERGRTTVVPVEHIDWIETQGNYQALHVSGRVHLLRETSARLQDRLDPRSFTRIHRRTIVALDRVRTIRPLANGDALVELSTGQELRLSRNHRAGLLDRMKTVSPR